MLLRYSPKTSHVKMIVCENVEGFVPERKMVQLLPGTNEVTEAEWACIKPTLSSELESGEVIILAQKVSDGRGKPGGRKARNLVQMPVNIAVKYVSECLNADTLKKWYSEETREEVRNYIVRKMKKLDIELPEDEIPDAPNASPMSLEELDTEDDDFDLEDEDSKNDELDTEDELSANDNVDLNTLKVEQLREMAKELGIEGWQTMKKNELIDSLSN